MNIHEFFQCAVKGLEKYILIHYDKAYWFEHWVGVSDVRKYFENTGGKVTNPYFTFDWRVAAYRRMAEDVTVPRTHATLDVIGKSDAEPKGMMGVEDAWRFFAKRNYPIADKYLMAALMEDCWRAFCDSTHPVTDPIAEEAYLCLKAITSDRNPEDLLDHCLWSLKIFHANGNIANDYSELSWEEIDRVRSSGPAAIFGRNDIIKFLNGEYPPITVDMRRLTLAVKNG